ncbi:MAG: 4Fe-4S binding protein [bacterium]|jgi:NADH-quinone oxidoreductase subunit I|nr:4Fe-4S binding protein [bacterium]
MGYFGDIAESLLTAVKGMGVTITRVVEKPNTVQWPHQPATTKPRTRSELFNNIDDCIGCLNCAKACPVDCIEIETVKSTKAVDLGRTSNGKKKTLHLARFDIDMAKCCYCGLCVDVCPTECLIMTEKFDYSCAEVTGLHYSFARMDEGEIRQAREALEEEKRQAAQAAAAAAEAKARAEAEAKAAPEAPPAPEAGGSEGPAA